MEQQKDGTITTEEAQAQLAKLDVELPTRGAKMDIFAGLDEETKEQVQSLIEETQDELAELGIDHLPFKHLTDEK